MNPGGPEFHAHIRFSLPRFLGRRGCRYCEVVREQSKACQWKSQLSRATDPHRHIP